MSIYLSVWYANSEMAIIINSWMYFILTYSKHDSLFEYSESTLLKHLNNILFTVRKQVQFKILTTKMKRRARQLEGSKVDFLKGQAKEAKQSY